jgi:hypothetical protein
MNRPAAGVGEASQCEQGGAPIQIQGLGVGQADKTRGDISEKALIQRIRFGRTDDLPECRQARALKGCFARARWHDGDLS